MNTLQANLGMCVKRTGELLSAFRETSSNFIFAFRKYARTVMFFARRTRFHVKVGTLIR